MKRIMVATLAGACVLASSAHADDVDWTGFYVGIGGHTASSDITFNSDPGAVIAETNLLAFSDKGSTEAAELVLGYKHDLGMLVVGAELRPSLGGEMTVMSSVEKDLFPGLPPGLFTVLTDDTVTVKTSGSLMGTIEVPVGRLLIGGGLGVARAKVDMSGDLLGPPDFFSGVREDWMSYSGTASKTAFMWEARTTFALSKSLRLTARYGQANFGTFSAPASLGPDLDLGGSVLSPVETSVKSTLFSANISYQF